MRPLWGTTVANAHSHPEGYTSNVPPWRAGGIPSAVRTVFPKGVATDDTLRIPSLVPRVFPRVSVVLTPLITLIRVQGIPEGGR
jgi:hypothetical protein